MQIGIICPTGFLEHFASQSNYHLVLAHMVRKDRDYKEFYRKASTHGDYITLDNSSCEIGDDVFTPEQLVDFARDVGAKEVMAPETAFDADSTIDKVREFMKVTKYIRGSIKVFGTLHGSAMGDIIRCHNNLVGLGVDTIGISFRIQPKPMKDFVRHPNKTVDTSLARVQAIMRLEPFMKESIRYHLLGIVDPKELLYYYYNKFIKSVDSSCAYVSGITGKLCDDAWFEKPKEKLDFSNKYISGYSLKRVHFNIQILKKLARNEMEGTE
ncbi:MAG: hypothetical protein FVQ80_06590 [Planctomycetes bacterium]|nr:hypothetical protein [Planctomycetota bacterium]